MDNYHAAKLFSFFFLGGGGGLTSFLHAMDGAYQDGVSRQVNGLPHVDNAATQGDYPTRSHC